MTSLEKGERRKGRNVMERLGYYRFIRGIKINAIAEKIGVSGPCLSNYERGKHQPPFFVVDELCKALGLKLIIVNKEGKKLYESNY